MEYAQGTARNMQKAVEIREVFRLRKIENITSLDFRETGIAAAPFIISITMGLVKNKNTNIKIIHKK